MNRIHNFSAGPSALPQEVLEQAASEFVNFRGHGASLLEMSHRGKVYDAVHDECIEDLGSLLGITDDYAMVFMGGGARTQFALIPSNLRPTGAAGFINTGRWAQGAVDEAAKLGEVRELWSSVETGHDRVPEQGEVACPQDLQYLHYTSNNTIYGTEFQYVPDSGDVPLVCDMSSDILARPVDVTKFGMIYAGAQKNLGPAGVVVLVIRKDLLARSRDTLPELWNYQKIAAKNSMLNTPPVYAIYMVGLVAKYLQRHGGAAGAWERNQRKAASVYGEIDADGFWTGHAQVGSRSYMNVTFRSPSAELDKAFVAEADAAGLSGLKGHRSVGGLRASIYNAVPEESVATLVEFMKEFRRTKG
ncbi:MAG: 3-phosphoserine/phosphohydroxythreonine transaminase [Deltaproteobacteria bacterium]|nr:3-phosphoserine/phosphohydroxythreonine transaminase [Deltaproteobacteria bacterium]